jgi:predicted extracellular nuclease
MKKTLIYLIVQIFMVTLYVYVLAQEVKPEQKRIISFYNCENYYDTIDQKNIIDEEFTPNSAKAYNKNIFKLKRQQIAKTIYELGKQEQQDGISLMGLVEIENKYVLEELVKDSLIRKYQYQIIHFDSKDYRGIDVALLFHPEHFKPYQYKPIPLSIKNHQTDFPTRDILYVKGQLDQQWIHILVNHWPSRRGGSRDSEKRRIWASQVARNFVDSLLYTDPIANIIMMGDFNDNPTDASLLNIPLKNPFYELFKKGLGSLAFNDQWNLFDQILISEPLTKFNNNLTYYKSIIYNKKDRREAHGRYKGYPKRTWSGNQYNAGFSDHFPVSIILNLKMAENPLK